MKDPRVYLAHILECIRRIETFTEGGEDAFLSERIIQDAVMRNLEVMGEAAKRVPDNYREAHPKIPWRGMATLRDVLIHDYEGVNLNQVWEVIEHELPRLKQALESFLPPLEQLEQELAGDLDAEDSTD